MINVDNMSFEYFPYPIGLVADPIDADYYRRLSESFPPLELFKDIDPKLPGCKYSLSDVNNSANMHRFLNSNADWNKFYNFLKSDAFIITVLNVFKKNNVDLQLSMSRPGMIDRLAEIKNALMEWRLPQFRQPLTVRVEFSAVPSKGGFLKPHTDHPKKLVTLVFGMAKPGEWKDEFGGATDVLIPKDPRQNFNYNNRQLEFEDTELVKRYHYGPNQCLAFIKTFNSLHAVQPTVGNTIDPIRKTVTVNIIGSSPAR